MILKGKNSFLVTCDCGCGNSVLFKAYDDSVVISFLSSDFYNKQFSLFDAIDKKLKEILSIKHKKPYILYDVIINKEDIKSFIDALESLDIKNNENQTKNTGFLYVDTSDMEECNCFELMLINKTNLIDTLKLKTYKAYDVTLNKKSYEIFITKCKQKLQKGDTK